MNGAWIFVIGLLLFTTCCWSQCSLTVSAGEDLYLCPGEQVTLNGSMMGNFDFVQWTPPNGLSDPTILNPTTDQAGIYTLYAEYNTGNNIILNGDFSQGVSQFSSDYQHSTAGSIITCPSGNEIYGFLGCEGTYDVLSDPSLGHTNFTACPDQSGDGNMLVVNGASTADVEIWCQTVAVDPDALYLFSAWVAQVNPSNPPNLQFTVNGDPLGGNFSSNGVCAWSENSAQWEANGATSATICVTNQNTDASGNDFALDNISFIEICTATDQVEVFPVELELDLAVPMPIDCSMPIATLQVGNAAGTGIDYYGYWILPDGSTIDNAFPPAYEIQSNQPGTYSFIYEFNNGQANCEIERFVELGDNRAYFDSEAIAPEELSCDAPTVRAFVEFPNDPNNYQYFWYTLDGEIISDDARPDVEVGEPGTYFVVITNISTGCQDTSEVQVEKSLNIPEARISPTDTINCENASILIDGSASTVPDYSDIIWETFDGIIDNYRDDLLIEVSTEGTYHLILYNPDNPECSDTTEITVVEFLNQPSLDPISDSTLNCVVDSLALPNVAVSNNEELIWTVDGNIIVRPTDYVIRGGGTFIVEVQDTLSNCFVKDTFVVEDLSLPVDPNIQEPEVLTCSTDTVSLSWDINRPINNGEFRWSNMQNMLLSETDSILSVIEPGWYILEVTDPVTMCSGVDTISVDIDTLISAIDVTPEQTLPCDLDQVTLSASTSSNSQNPEWRDEQGSILGNTWQIEVENPGVYYIEITNPSNGCTNLDSTTVIPDTDAPIIDTDINGVITCANPTVSVLVTGTSASGASLMYTWSDLDGEVISNNQSIEVSESGPYTAEAIDASNGCSTSTSVVVPIDTIRPTMTLITPDTLSCEIEVALVGAIANEDSVRYQWRSAITGEEIENQNPVAGIAYVFDPGWYYVELRNEVNGCTSTDSIEVISLQDYPEYEKLPIDTLNCFEENVELIINSDFLKNELRWQNTNNENTTDSQSSSSVNEPNTYYFSITDELTGCEIVDSFTVYENKSMPDIDVLTPDTLSCIKKEVSTQINLSDNEGIDIEWLNESESVISNSNVLTVDEPGLFKYVVYNRQNGCTDSGTVVVDDNISYPENIFFQKDNAACDRDEGTIHGWSAIDAYPPLKWSIDNMVIPSITDSIQVSVGLHLLSATNRLGCTSYDTVEIMRTPSIQAFIDPDHRIAWGDELTLEAQYNMDTSEILRVEWSPYIDLDCQDCWQVIASPTQDTRYYLDVWDIYGCKDRVFTDIEVWLDPKVWVPNSFSPNGDGANDLFYPHFSTRWIEEVRNFQIYNRWGDLVYEIDEIIPNDPYTGWDGSFRDESLNPDVFVYHFTVKYVDGRTELIRGDVTLLR